MISSNWALVIFSSPMVRITVSPDMTGAGGGAGAGNADGEGIAKGFGGGAVCCAQMRPADTRMPAREKQYFICFQDTANYLDLSWRSSSLCFRPCERPRRQREHDLPAASGGPWPDSGDILG